MTIVEVALRASALSVEALSGHQTVAVGYSAEETARTIGSTPGAVRVTQHRALVKLRALLAQRMADALPDRRRRCSRPLADLLPRAN